MRVFDCYYFNIADKVRFKDAKPYIDDMLAELGLRYNKTAFRFRRLMPGTYDKIFAKLPELQRYLYHSPRTDGSFDCDEMTSCLPLLYDMRETVIGSESDIYVRHEDEAAVYALFAGIPRTYSTGEAELYLDGIDWTGGEDISAAFHDYPANNADRFMCNGIRLGWSAGSGTKTVNVRVSAEVTKNGGSRDTGEVISLLEPYLGTPEHKHRSSCMSSEELARKRAAGEKYHTLLSEVFTDIVGEYAGCDKGLVPKEPIKPICDKQTIVKAYKGTGLEDSYTPTAYPGLSNLIFTDRHGFEYTVEYNSCTRFIDENCFGYGIGIRSYNFDVSFGTEFYIRSKEHAVQIIEKTAVFTVKAVEAIGVMLASECGKNL